MPRSCAMQRWAQNNCIKFHIIRFGSSYRSVMYVWANAIIDHYLTWATPTINHMICVQLSRMVWMRLPSASMSVFFFISISIMVPRSTCSAYIWMHEWRRKSHMYRIYCVDLLLLDLLNIKDKSLRLNQTYWSTRLQSSLHSFLFSRHAHNFRSLGTLLGISFDTQP